MRGKVFEKGAIFIVWSTAPSGHNSRGTGLPVRRALQGARGTARPYFAALEGSTGRPSEHHAAVRRLRIGPGSSGGPVIDRNGRVVTMIFAGRDPNGGRDAFGIPRPLIRDALRKALSSAQRVDTGDCREE
jgi:S1-C subfamily serine protease